MLSREAAFKEPKACIVGMGAFALCCNGIYDGEKNSHARALCSVRRRQRYLFWDVPPLRASSRLQRPGASRPCATKKPPHNPSFALPRRPMPSVFSSFATAGSTGADTGFSEHVLLHLWSKYASRLPRMRSERKLQRSFYDAFRFIHLAPRPSHVQSTLGFSERHWYRAVEPVLLALALAIDEVHWADRHSACNHVVHFPFWAVGCLDTFPVYMSKPSDQATCALYWQGKYGGPVMKVQIIVDFECVCCCCTAPRPLPAGES